MAVVCLLFAVVCSHPGGARERGICGVRALRRSALLPDKFVAISRLIRVPVRKLYRETEQARIEIATHASLPCQIHRR